MLDPFDFKEPSCALCGGKDFYYPDKNKPAGRIPVSRIISKLDDHFDHNELDEAQRLLEYWQNEAKVLNDKEGELTITNELIGLYRKTANSKKSLLVVNRAISLIEEMNLSDNVSAGTILLNCATNLKAFNLSEKAMPLYDRAYEIYKKRLKSDDVLFAGFYNNKALCLADLNKYDDALQCFLSAIKIMEKAPDGKLDLAVTYVNMAHLYENNNKDKKLITDCLFNAYNSIMDDSVARNGYFAFVCSKCAPSFMHFGYKVIYDELNSLSEKIYERS